ncbi:hypothetical protein A3Q56_07600 [Intoshia linei]|uniref:Uncharacterized protein n=1 Tax=Intoshia linei TaxID=1819745 RepID=A0A177ATG9_9BILA|nr:hypothetical protein A3Q56_07600 [Intoshia linei]
MSHPMNFKNILYPRYQKASHVSRTVERTRVTGGSSKNGQNCVTNSVYEEKIVHVYETRYVAPVVYIPVFTRAEPIPQMRYTETTRNRQTNKLKTDNKKIGYIERKNFNPLQLLPTRIITEPVKPIKFLNEKGVDVMEKIIKQNKIAEKNYKSHGIAVHSWKENNKLEEVD